MRFTEHDLKLKALAALEDINKRADKGRVEQTPEIASLLAWLANGHDRAMFRWWWESLQSADVGRQQNVSAALNGIYRTVGVERP